MEPDSEGSLIDGGRRRPIVPWLIALLALGGAGWLYFGAYRPLQEQGESNASKMSGLEQKLREANSTVDAGKQVKADLQKAQDDLKQMREDLARSAAQKSEDDRLLGELKKQLGEGGEVADAGGRITVTMVDKILFKSGESDLSPQGEEVLRKLGAVFKGLDKLIQVSGHADNTPVRSDLKELFPTNWELSTARATNVVRFLQDEVGVRPRQLMAAGYGEYRPVASNKTVNGRAKNRRIEILLLPDKMKVVKGDFADELASAEPAAKKGGTQKGATAAPPRPKDRDRLAAIAAAHANANPKKKKTPSK